jgi:hypothetical protein
MQKIPAVVLIRQKTTVRGTPYDLVKINDRIEPPTCPYPLIHPLPRLLPLRIRIRLDARVRRRRAKGRYGRRENRQSNRVDPADDLLVRCDDPVAHGLLGRGVRRCRPNVVYAFEEHGEADARMREDVAVDARERVGTESIGENAIASCCLVGNGNVGALGLEHAGEKLVGPSADGLLEKKNHPLLFIFDVRIPPPIMGISTRTGCSGLWCCLFHP